MAIQASGPVSMGNLATEFGGAAPHSISEYYRGALVPNGPAQNAGVPLSGQISLGQFYGSANVFSWTYTVPGGSNFNLRAAAIAAGWNGIKVLIANITISSHITSTSTAAYAFLFANAGQTFPAGSSIVVTINAGIYIVGRGGAGAAPQANGAAGGPAMYIPAGMGVVPQIYNYGVVGGGGGSGGGGGPGWRGTICNGGPDVGTGADPSGAGAGFGSTDGTLTAGGPGYVTPGAKNGAGGTLGAPGGAGGWTDTYGGYHGTVGGAGGAATTGAANASWLVVGTRYGVVG